jgi:hypothetical protein
MLKWEIQVSRNGEKPEIKLAGFILRKILAALVLQLGRKR